MLFINLGLRDVILDGTCLAIYALLFVRGLGVPIRFLSALLLAFEGGYCYNLFGSTQVLQGFPVQCSAYFPNSTVGFSS